MNSSHPVFKKYRPSPQWDEPKPSLTRSMVVDGSITVAFGTDGTAVLPWFYAYHNGFDTFNFLEACLAIDKGFEFMATIEQGFQQHRHSLTRFVVATPCWGVCRCFSNKNLPGFSLRKTTPLSSPVVSWKSSKTSYKCRRPTPHQRRSYADVLLDWNRAIGHPKVVNLPTHSGEDPNFHPANHAKGAYRGVS